MRLLLALWLCLGWLPVLTLTCWWASPTSWLAGCGVLGALQ